MPPYRAEQIYKWITRGAVSFEQMTDIPKPLQKELSGSFKIFSGKITGCNEDNYAKKAVIALEDNVKIESVLLKDGKERFTACLSVQAGCPARCVFCKTGSIGFKRNLESREIIEQYLHLLSLTPQKQKSAHVIGNIVIMGIGEPLLNLYNLKKAIDIFTDPNGINFSRRRITVSTCGICGGLEDIAKNGPFVRIALSLTTADETLRARLMPVTKSNPLPRIKKSLSVFQKNGGGRITLEVPLLSGINTREQDAESIFEFAKGLVTVVNIIPWNPVEGLEFNGKPLREPDSNEVKNFISMLESRKLKVTMRRHKGRKVSGACGQLGEISGE